MNAWRLSAAVDTRTPDLVVLGLTAGATTASAMLKTLADKNFEGKILPFAARDSAVVATIQEHANKLGISLLPPLFMPFSNEALRESVAMLLPEPPSGPLLDMAEIVRKGWLELWYQPKIDARAIVMRGAEALLRVRHPVWGIVPLDYFAPPNDGDPRFGAILDSMIDRAVDDWHHFFARGGPVETAINLPIAFLKDPESISRLQKKLPNQSAFDGLMVEINSIEVVLNLNVAKDLARELRLHKIAISIDDLGAEWLSLTGVSNFPFVELKVDRKFVTGCADDPLKQSICRRILDLANSYGARTVAQGVETWSDFIAVRDMGFDLVQGSLFGKPMSREKFAQTCWAAPQAAPSQAPSRSMEQLVFVSHARRQGDAHEQPVRLSSEAAGAQWR